MKKGIGVDCWRFCYGVFYEWIDMPFSNPYTNFGMLTNLSNSEKKKAARVVRYFFPLHKRILSPSFLIPGDILYWPHHLAITGTDAIWDCKVGVGVQRTGLDHNVNVYRYDRS